MESDRYGIGNIDLSHVDLAEVTAIVVPERVEIANSDQQGHIDCAERLRQVRTLWQRRDELPAAIAALLAQHAQHASRGGPLGLQIEETVAEVQRAAAAYARTLGVAGSETCDAVPLLLASLLQQRTVAAAEPPAAIEGTIENVLPEVPGSLALQQVPPQLEEKAPDEDLPSDHSDHVESPPTDVETPTLPADTSSSLQEDTGEEDDSPDLSEVDRQAEPRPAPRKRRYQPQARGAGRRAEEERTPRREQTDRACPIEVRLRSRTGGTITVSQLPRRREGMPEEVEAAGAGPVPLFLSALHEAWFQDVVPANIGTVLRTGVAWYADRPDGRLQWSLSGRDLYVLGPRDELSGFVSRPRLVLGDQHTVLCTADRRSQVLALLQECCEAVPPNIEAEDGLPEGWVGFRSVVPIRPLPPSPSPDILDALRPTPDLQISLRGGIRLQYSQWLAGFPPAVRLFGAAANQEAALSINGRDAVRGTDGTFTAPGWDTLGDHVVACQGLTRTYNLVASQESWEAWPAWPAHGAGLTTICGAKVGAISTASFRPSVVVPTGNALLLGRQPGEIYLCAIRSDIRLGLCSGSPPFQPVWAVPPTPLHVDKSTARIILLEAPTAEDAVLVRPSGAAVRRWCNAILNCARKGLRLTGDSPEAAAAWRSCRDQARAIWRRTR